MAAAQSDERNRQQRPAHHRTSHASASATRALRQVGGTDPPTLEDNLLRSALLRLRCEAAGAQARFAGVRRASNPFARATAPEPITWLTPAARAELAAAWWRGWDGTG